MDYGNYDKRRTKKDLKRKARYNKYKQGGRHRTSNISVENKNKEI